MKIMKKRISPGMLTALTALSIGGAVMLGKKGMLGRARRKLI